MFEQSLFNRDTPARPTRSGDFLHNYELRSWKLTPRIYKIVAASVAFNILAILVAGQTSLLTMKGCDSPLVGRVCQVLDTVYVGSLLFGTDREYVDAVYEKSELEDADITFVDVSGETPPLSYPEGYFQIANPQQFAMLQQQAQNPDSGFGSSSFPKYSPPTGIPGGLINTTPITPKSNPNSVVGAIPDSPLGSIGGPGSVIAGRGKRGNGKVKKSTDLAKESPEELPELGDETAEIKSETAKTPENSDPISGVELNKRPFVDLGIFVNDLLDKKEVDLSTEFMINAQGKLKKDGKLDPKSFRYVQAASSDAKMIEVVKESIEAINDSGYLQYLKDISGKDFNLVLQQDDSNITAVVQSEMESETRAKSIKSGLELLIGLAKSRKSGAGADQNDKDDLLLLENAKIESDGKKVVIKFLVPKGIAIPMIQRKLAEQRNEAKKPSGNALTTANQNTAAR
ncbi:MAG: hypothetical protein WBD22_03815 [Pyrinomonadaceae bacterium]